MAEEDNKPAAAGSEYPKWIGAGHDGVVVNSKEEEDALTGAKPEAPKTADVPPEAPLKTSTKPSPAATKPEEAPKEPPKPKFDPLTGKPLA